MNKAKCDAQDYIHFLVAAQNVFSSVEAAATHSDGEDVVALCNWTQRLLKVPSIIIRAENFERQEHGMRNNLRLTFFDSPFGRDKL